MDGRAPGSRNLVKHLSRDKTILHLIQGWFQYPGEWVLAFGVHVSGQSATCRLSLWT